MKGARRFDTVDFRKKETSVRAGAVEWELDEDATIHGFGAWWKCTLVPGVVLSTSPDAPATHWEQIILPLFEPLQCKKGDTLQLHLTSDTRYKTGLRVRWEISLRRAGKVVSVQKIDTRKGE